MSLQGFAAVMLWAVLAAAQDTAFIEQQQHVLDMIAEQIRKDGLTSCTAPQLATCGNSACFGTNCGSSFYVAFTTAKEITGLFVSLSSSSFQVFKSLQ